MTQQSRAQVYESLKDLRRRGEMADLTPNDTESVRILEIRALADRIFGSEAKADLWLHRPNASLSGQKPIDLTRDDLGAAVVRETLEQIDHGMIV